MVTRLPSSAMTRLDTCLCIVFLILLIICSDCTAWMFVGIPILKDITAFFWDAWGGRAGLIAFFGMAIFCGYINAKY